MKTKRWLTDLRERFCTFETLKGGLFLLGAWVTWMYPEYFLQGAMVVFLGYEGLRKVFVNRVKQQARKEVKIEARKQQLSVQVWPVLLLALVCLPQALCIDDCRISEHGLKHLERWEGYVPTLYRDVAGYWTVCTGHLVSDEEFKRWRGKTFTATECRDLLRGDVAEHEAYVNRDIIVPLLPWQFDAFVSLNYNIGPANFRRSSARRYANRGAHDRVPGRIRLWNKARVGGRLRVVRGLDLRRASESKMYAEGW